MCVCTLTTKFSFLGMIAYNNTERNYITNCGGKQEGAVHIGQVSSCFKLVNSQRVLMLIPSDKFSTHVGVFHLSH